MIDVKKSYPIDKIFYKLSYPKYVWGYNIKVPTIDDFISEGTIQLLGMVKETGILKFSGCDYSVSANDVYETRDEILEILGDSFLKEHINKKICEFEEIIKEELSSIEQSKEYIKRLESAIKLFNSNN